MKKLLRRFFFGTRNPIDGDAPFHCIALAMRLLACACKFTIIACVRCAQFFPFFFGNRDFMGAVESETNRMIRTSLPRNNN